MREILFRGKRIDNGEWVYGYIVKHGVCWWIYPGERYIAEECIEEFKLTFYHSVKFEVDPETICQYTGLTDKNGKKIFEGDIVNFLNRLAVTGPVYETLIVSYDSFAGYKGILAKKYEVVGNIFDNPELLEEKS